MTDGTTVKIRLERAGRIMRAAVALRGALWWLGACMVMWLVLFWLDNVLSLPPAVRLPLAIAGLVASVTWLVRKVILPAGRLPRPERTARLLEQKCGMGDNMLINAYQFEGRPHAGREVAFVEQTVKVSLDRVGRIQDNSLWDAKSMAKLGAYAAVVLVVWFAYAFWLPRLSLNALARYALPMSDIPPVGSLAIVVDPGRDTIANEGEDVAVKATVRPANRTAASVTPVPSIQWAEGRSLPARAGGESVAMHENKDGIGYSYVFRSVRRSFVFRVSAGDTTTRSVFVDVVPSPRLRSSTFAVTPPSYTGRGTQQQAGPPAALSCLPGSSVELALEFDRPLAGATWVLPRGAMRLDRQGNIWKCATLVTNAGPYEVAATDPKRRSPVVVAASEVALDVDHPPEIDFVTDNRNLILLPGAELRLELKASDDFGVREIRVTAQPSGDIGRTNGVMTLKKWSYIGPPGNAGPIHERMTVVIAPDVFAAGECYTLVAECSDFRPGGVASKSGPIVLRVKTLADLNVRPDDPLCRAVELLKKTVAEQQKANDLTVNLRTHAEDAVANRRIAAHRDAMSRKQGDAQRCGGDACREFAAHPKEGAAALKRLSNLVDDEMRLAMGEVRRVPDGPVRQVDDLTAQLLARQTYILDELISLLGTVVSDRSAAAARKAARKQDSPQVATRDAMTALRDDLNQFVRAQEDVLKKSRTLADRGPEDLTAGKEEIVGELAREEFNLGRFIEDKVNDFGKMPAQDFADSAMAKELNEVVQDVDLASKSLYSNKVEMAVPMEQSGLEKAEDLVHNIEKWLSNIPDNVKWSMEEPPGTPDVPMAELPSELEDIVGDLLDKEEEMNDAVEDITSSWLDSIDKGAGWTAADGPISSMSAKGITGNMLPNQMEIGGRSGEGRSGRSSGQMVEDSAVGKDGRQTPTRLTPSPFEQGSVKDSSTKDPGGATGGGKLSGFSEQGLRGPTRPPTPDAMARLSGQQAKIRQEAETLALKLRKSNLPSGDLESSVQAMKVLEDGIRRRDGVAVRHAYSEAVGGLQTAQSAVRTETGVVREKTRLPDSGLGEIMTGWQENTPKGYEEIVAEYFRRMAGGGK